MNKVFLIILLGLLFACDTTETPKPHGYFRFDLPEKQYRIYDSTLLPFNFEYPVYGKIVPASTNKYWFNINFPDYNATIYLSYREVNQNLGKLMEDVHQFLYKHQIKSDGIDPHEYMNTEKHIYGMLFDIGGDAASSLQFYLTDSTKNFIRGSLYFYCEPNRDSLAPLIDFFKEDIQYFMETFSFEE